MLFTKTFAGGDERRVHRPDDAPPFTSYLFDNTMIAMVCMTLSSRYECHHSRKSRIPGN